MHGPRQYTQQIASFRSRSPFLLYTEYMNEQVCICECAYSLCRKRDVNEEVFYKYMQQLKLCIYSFTCVHGPSLSFLSASTKICTVRFVSSNIQIIHDRLGKVN